MGKRNYNHGMFCVTLELYPEKWQADIIDKRLECLKLIYNSLNKKLKRIYHDMTQRREYKDVESDLSARTKYISKYEIPRIKKQKSERVKGDTIRPFTEFGFISYSINYNKPFSKAGINSSMISDVISRLWSSWEKFLYHKGKTTHYTRIREKANPFRGWMNLDISWFFT